MQEMVMPKVVRIQETVRMQEMGRMQEMVMKDRVGKAQWVPWLGSRSCGSHLPHAPRDRGSTGARAQGQRHRGGIWIRWVSCSGVEGLGLS